MFRNLRRLRAYKEAIELLKRQKPINEIEFDEEESKVAEECAKILSNLREEENKEDKNNVEERAEKYLDYYFGINECIDFGSSTGIHN